jgi:hypothetical protein
VFGDGLPEACKPGRICIAELQHRHRSETPVDELRPQSKRKHIESRCPEPEGPRRPTDPPRRTWDGDECDAAARQLRMLQSGCASEEDLARCIVSELARYERARTVTSGEIPFRE